MDLLMVRDRATGRFVYTERLERRFGETPWAYVRRSVRREGQIRTRFNQSTMEVIVGWGTGSVEEFLSAYPEYRVEESNSSGTEDDKLKGGTVDR
ncbi:MAG TPA: hypothetical protein VFJ72_07910 [Rubrobacteraceae bacterium]|nr:hypothetical protein [Rubrobacteraceae bacterium]